MKHKTTKQLRDKAWKLTSIFVRSKGADWRGYIQCFTCPTIDHWKNFDCGHYIHGKLDYDLRNLKPQCKKCNNKMWGGGRLDIYAERLIKENGVEWVEKLRKDAYEKGNRYTRVELEEIIKNLKD